MHLQGTTNICLGLGVYYYTQQFKLKSHDLRESACSLHCYLCIVCMEVINKIIFEVGPDPQY